MNIITRYAVISLLSIIINVGVSFADPVGELEPNDSKTSATQLFRGHTGVGNISTGADFDMWQIPNVHSGEKLYMLYSAEPQPPSAVDPVLTLTDQTDETIEYNDDGGPPASAFSDSLIVGRAAKRNGSLFAKLDGFGSSTGTYELFSLLARSNEFGAEIEPNDSVGAATAINAPVMRGNGSVDPDYYAFHANTGEKIVVMVDNDPINRDDVTADPTPVPIRFQSEIDVFAPDGTTIVSDSGSVTAHNYNSDRNAAGAIVAPSTGTFYVRIQKLGGFDQAYDLVVLVDGDTPLTGACCVGGVCNLKSNVNCEGYFSGVGTTCNGDDDADAIVNDCDNCRSFSNPAQEDNDLDNVGNACDNCSEDPLKLTPGACGCGTSDLDSDADGAANCNDACPADAGKTSPGTCGCGVSDADSNSNQIADCLAGPEVKAQVQTLIKKVRTLGSGQGNSSKGRQVKKLLSALKNKVQQSSGFIIITKSGFNLGSNISRFSSAINKVLRGNSAGKASAQKIGRKIIGSIA